MGAEKRSQKEKTTLRMYYVETIFHPEVAMKYNFQEAHLTAIKAVVTTM